MSAILGMGDGLKWTMCAILVLLATGSVVSAALARLRPDKDYSELRSRVRTWWVMAGVFLLAMVFDRRISIGFMGFVSFVALKEYLSLIPTRRADRRALFWAYLSVPFQYYWVASEWYGMFIIFIPVYAFLLVPVRMVIAGDTRDFLRSAGTIHWGLMTTVFSISHMALLLVMPGGGAELVLFIVVLTQCNDIAQYVWGKSFGRRKVVPSVSPGKSWEGWLGGIATSAGLGALLAPKLTPFPAVEAAWIGAAVGIAGFCGDVTISAVKRDIGVKDSGGLLPGHGGILDRVDSLTFTAPLFLHYFRYFHT